MSEKLLVDGYNVIGAWPELKKLKQQSLELARDQLLEILQEYQAISGKETTVVFDAYLTPWSRTFIYKGPIEVVYTKENETADELIERLVYESLKHKYVYVWVVTDDLIEQQVTFGEGALRITTSELKKMVKESKRTVHHHVQKLNTQRKRNLLSESVDQRVAEMLEKWRRK